MNVSHRWLRELLPSLSDPARVVAERLAMLGAPVDEVLALGEPLRDIRIARVLEVRRHPNADRLSLCQVDAGTGLALSVVCGAPNVRAGACYPFAPAGARLPDGTAIRRSKIRGEESNGMLCSAAELQLGRDHDGILELHGEFQPGASFVDAVGLNDTRLVIDVTPNRPDLLSHWGVARELAAAGEADMLLPAFPGQQAERPGAALRLLRGDASVAAAGVRITLEDGEGCPRYLGTLLRGLHIAPSPEWLASRLRAVGLRPINNVVDATNWVLYELGQPLHAFDLRALGDTIVVRRARAGEALVTLDGETRRLTPAVLVIADAQRPVALAGIMGGRETEVRADTTDVLLECALFAPQTVRAGRRLLGMNTDASYRFERGVDPDMMERALGRAVDLICATAGGRPELDVPFADAGLPLAAMIELRAARAVQVLGVPVSLDEMTALLRPLGFTIQATTPHALSARVPGHRRYDVFGEADLIEEVARRRGYDTFPDELRPFRPSAVPDNGVARLEDRLRDGLVARGFLESRGMPLVPERDGDVALLLPLALTESRLRRALLPGLTHRVEANFNRGARDVRLFEIGTVFAPGGEGGLPREATHLAAIMTGGRSPEHWSGPVPVFDVWDLKGLLEELADELGGAVRAAEAGAGDRLEMVVGEPARIAGEASRVPPESMDAPAWAAPVWGLEIELLPSMTARPGVMARALPAQPAVDRDIALIAPEAVTAQALLQALRESGGPLLETAYPFDVYVGEGIPAGRRSIAFRLRFRAADRTLTVAEVDAVLGRILERLKQEHHAERR